ncbi:MAG: hypothetical protein PHW96_01810 [Candidatus Nanoarchaeia archaeon]|nr:hypothetical protein [Candidatus Nanoarchaeia archaeon]
MNIMKSISWKPFVDAEKQGWLNISISYSDEKIGLGSKEEPCAVDMMVHENVIRDILPKLGLTLEHVEKIKKGEQIKLSKKDMVKVESANTSDSMFG